MKLNNSKNNAAIKVFAIKVLPACIFNRNKPQQEGITTKPG